MARPPALCPHCGHDVARGASTCGRCSGEQVPWVLAPRGEIVDVSAWLTVPLGLAIAVALILFREEHPTAHILLGICLIAALLLVAVIVFLGEAHWTSSVGATAKTFHGRLTAAHGQSPEHVVHHAPGQELVRGDVLYDGAGASREALPAAFGGNPVEITLVAAIMGALARGRITLVETRARGWKRIGIVRTETAQRHGGTFALTVVARLHADEDAVAALLLGPFYPPAVGDYRGSTTAARDDGALRGADRRTIGLLELLRAAFPGAQKPGRTMRRSLPRGARDPGEAAALRALLTTIAQDPRSATWIALRDALRRALALRGRQVG